MDLCKDRSEAGLNLHPGVVSATVVITPHPDDGVRMIMTLKVFTGDGNCLRTTNKLAVVAGVVEATDNVLVDPAITQTHSQMTRNTE